MTTSQQFQRYCRTRFGIGEGVVMIFKVIAAGGCRDVELMAGQVETAARGGKSAMKFIVGIWHAIFLKGRFETTLIKRTVVGHQR